MDAKMFEGKEKLVVLTGPTASGKTALAVKLAEKYSAEIISADSRQCYCGMDLGSGKDLSEYGSVPYHLIDIETPDREYNLARFARDARKAIRDIADRGRLPLVCGGSVLYCDALISAYELPGGEPDPEFRRELNEMPLPELEARLRAAGGGENFKDWGNRNRMRRALEIALAGDVKDRYVPQYETLVLGVFVPRPLLHERIAARLDARFDAGMLDEIKYLHDGKGVSWERLESFGLEYRRCAEHLQGKVDFQTMRDTLLTDIRHFAKRQDIWFRKLEKKGIDIYWLEGDRFAEACSLMDTFLAGAPLPEPGRRMTETCYGRKSQ